MKISMIAVQFLLLVSNLLPAVEMTDFVPRHSRQVLQINLTEIIGMEAVRDDMIRTFFRQTGFEKKNNPTENISSSIDKILLVTPVLTESETFVFIQTKVKKDEFCRRLNEAAEIRQIPVKNENRTEYRILLPETDLIPGIAAKKRIFVFTFLTDNIAVVAKDSLAGYWKYKAFGLPVQKRKYLTVPNSLAAGYMETDPAFLQENPFLPPFQEAVYSLAAAAPAGSLDLKAWARCADETAANQTRMQLQQYVMVGGLLLNQTAPELMQEWINAVRVSGTGEKVFLNAFFSRDFLTRLTAASEKLTEASQSTKPSKEKR